MTTYQAHGFEDRDAYLADLAEAAEEHSYMVYALADLLGPEEDFDGLITALQDEGIEV